MGVPTPDVHTDWSQGQFQCFFLDSVLVFKPSPIIRSTGTKGAVLKSKQIKQICRQAGFDLVGICPAVTPNGLSRLHQWLDAGFAGEMDYIQRRREAYSHPDSVFNGVKSLIVLGLKYAGSKQPEKMDLRVSRYAQSGMDYHDVIHEKLKTVRQQLERELKGFRFRGVVDTAPLLEREFAQLAGLGWQGKNTMLISKTDGSWFFLAALLTDLKLDYDQPFETSHCGTCTACIDACPTDAIVKPFVLDGSKCISYFTIESQSLPPMDLRKGIGEWLFGCDICQEVCPWNRKESAYVEAAEGSLAVLDPDFSHLTCTQLFELDDIEFRRKFRKTPFWRSKRRGILRNAAIVLGNRGDASLIPVLKIGSQDVEPLVRAACYWAIGVLGSVSVHAFLKKALQAEIHELVRKEIQKQLISSPGMPK